MKITLIAVFKKVPEGYVAFVEELPGANTQGYTLDEARRNLEEAILMVLEANKILAEEQTSDFTFKESLNYGDNLKITLKEGCKIKNLRRDRVGLIRLGSVTHSFNFDQRYIGLKILGDVDIPYVQPSTLDLEKSEFDVIIPNNPNLLPPGYYMLFLLSGLVDIQGIPGFPRLGAPSIAKIIKIG